MKARGSSLCNFQSFRCALSGHVVMGYPIHALDVNGVEYPISNCSYVRITDEVPHVKCSTDENVVGVVRIINGEDRHVEFCINLGSLRFASNWKSNIDHIMLDSEHVIRAKSVQVSNTCPKCDSQQEFSFV